MSAFILIIIASIILAGCSEQTNNDSSDSYLDEQDDQTEHNDQTESLIVDFVDFAPGAKSGYEYTVLDLSVINNWDDFCLLNGVYVITNSGEQIDFKPEDTEYAVHGGYACLIPPNSNLTLPFKGQMGLDVEIIENGYNEDWVLSKMPDKISMEMLDYHPDEYYPSVIYMSLNITNNDDEDAQLRDFLVITDEGNCYDLETGYLNDVNLVKDNTITLALTYFSSAGSDIVESPDKIIFSYWPYLDYPNYYLFEV